MVTIEQQVLKIVKAVQLPEDFVGVLNVVEVWLEEILIILNVALVECHILCVILTITGWRYE